jgi:membrane associated rhomboid family serine protease
MSLPSSTNWRDSLKEQAIILGGFILLIWLVELVDTLLFAGALDRFGVRPRTVAGLWGIFFAPFLHRGFGHVAANTVPFLVLGWLILVQNRRHFWTATAVTILVSGAGIWLFGRGNSVHVGASGLVFGYFGFLLLRGYFERSLSAILVAVLVVVLYGGLLWGVLPLQNGVSWQAHLFGFLGGGLAAYLLSQPAAPSPPFRNR